MKKVCVSLLVLLLIVRTNAIGVRQLQEFGDAKKQVEQLIRAYRQSGERSEDWHKKFEAQLAIIAKTDKKTADVYRAQMPKKIDESEEIPVQEELSEPDSIKFTSKASQDVISSEPKTIPEVKEKFSFGQEDEPLVKSEAQAQKEREEFASQPITETSPWPRPIITSKQEDRETRVISSTSSWTVPVPKEQVKAEKKQAQNALLVELQKLESAIDQALSKCKSLDFTIKDDSSFRETQFLQWDRSIDNYNKKLQELKTLNPELYQEKTAKIKNGQLLLAKKLVEQVLLSVELIRRYIEPLIETFTTFESTITGILFRNTSEFNVRAYQFFFGPLDNKQVWKSNVARNKTPWFSKDQDRKLLKISYWPKGIEQYFNLLFKYHNKENLITDEQAQNLKAKMDALREEIMEYRKLLGRVYNGMVAVIRDDKEEQMKLIENDYRSHLVFLQEVANKIQNDFIKKLWPEDRSISAV
jgi:hypothetical protein